MKGNYTSINSEAPIMVLKSSLTLVTINVLARIIPACVTILLGYIIVSFITNNFSNNPLDSFTKYWALWVTLFVLLATLWTFWFDVVTIYAYKSNMIVNKRGKKIIIYYDSIISFDSQRSVIVFIPIPTTRAIVSKGSGKINKLTSCNCITKKDYEKLYKLCNETRMVDCKIPMRRSTHLTV